MSRPIGDIIVHVILMGLAGYFLVESLSIRGSAAGGSLPPAFFPKAICTLLLILLGLSLIKAIRGLIVNRGQGRGPSVSPGAVVPVFAWLAVFLQLVVYAVMLEPIGYVVSTSLLVFCVVSTLVLLSATDERRVSGRGVAQLGGFSITVSFAIFVLFSKGFGIILPTLGLMGV